MIVKENDKEYWCLIYIFFLTHNYDMIMIVILLQTCLATTTIYY